MDRQDVIAYQKGASLPKPEWLRERLEWFQDQKFGLIIHWAPYALWDCCESWPISPGDEWARAEDMECWTSRGRNFEVFQRDYWNLNREFNPVKFDPKEWARLAKQAGARYLAFTTKHHDGFCMWDTKTTDYRITGSESPFRNNPSADLFKGICSAFQEQGLSISAYFSKADWHCPHYWSPDKPVLTRAANTLDDPVEWAKFVDYTHEQIRELMTGYGKIDVLWLDAGWVKEEEDIDMDGLAAMARELQPGLIIANRTVGDAYEDFVTPEREIPEEPLATPWESCLVMAENWKYNPRDKYRSCDQILEMLVETISKGGNLLLGLGPTPEGEFPPEAIERLEIIGRWMGVNSEAVYESRAVSPYKDGNLRFTQRTDSIYAFSFTRDEVVLNAFKPDRVELLGSTEPVLLTRHDSLLLHPQGADELPLPLVYKFKRDSCSSEGANR